MPKIDAPTVAQHRARQRAAILDAAGEQFAANGLLATDLADVARKVGLSRTALYRYFPDRDHLFVAWMDRLQAHVSAVLDRMLAGHADPRTRLEAWIDFQLDHVQSPAHDVGNRVLSELGALPTDLRQRVEESHAQLLRRLLPTVRALCAPEVDPELALRVIGSVVQTGAQALVEGIERDQVKNMILRSLAVLDGAT